MKEKERYILGEEFDGNRFNYYIKDIETNTLTYSSQMWLDLLNQQDKRIKELENQFSATEEMRLENLNDGCRCVERDSKRIVKLQQENQQLKDRWQKLQDDLMLFYTVGSTSDSYGYDVYKSIFDRMKELEKEKNNEVRNS